MGNTTGKGNITRDWSDLLPELVVEIADRLVSAEDYVALRGVCTSWRAAAGKNQFAAKPGSAPLLMLSGKDNSDDRRLYSVSKKKIFRKVSLPETNNWRKCLDAGFGWLVIVSISTSEVSLLNPISRAEFKLPPLLCFIVTAATLSSNPSDNSSDFVLMVIDDCRLFHFWRPGDASWTLAARFSVETTCFCKDRFYAIDRDGDVHCLDPDRLDDTDYNVVATLPIHLISREVDNKRLYLAGSSDGELILITRDADRFEVIQIDVMKGDWKVMDGLEKDHAVFIGHRKTFYVRDAKNPNCIYFIDENPDLLRHFDDMNTNLFKQGGVGVYNIQKQSIQRFESIRSASSLVWVDSSIIFSD